MPRLSVFRSNKHLFAQIIDVYNQGKVLLAVSEKDIKDKKGTKTDKARFLGEILAQKAKDKKIKAVVFDRSGYSFNGRIKALADAARKGGLNF